MLKGRLLMLKRVAEDATAQPSGVLSSKTIFAIAISQFIYFLFLLSFYVT
ncbi:hypothetical protein HMPREF5505_0832 [Lactobacillus delbrueckii subsp. lactis DSM 20072]|nr:hypothetical protein HMPREF5505_0832 [Lactobacillus delbrueckii subsp. lactis DSM 20072]